MKLWEGKTISGTSVNVIARVVCTVSLLICFATSAVAVPLGHVTDTVGALHYNIDNVRMFGGGAAPILVGPAAYVGGPCATFGGASSMYACTFGDGVNNIAAPYAWETAIQNPLPQGLLTARVGFFYPFGGPLLGRLTLGPGSTFHAGIIVNDALIGDIGNRLIWYSWRHPGGDILTSAAVIEGLHAVPYIGPGDGIANTHGEFWYHFHSSPDDSFVIDSNLNPNDLDYAFMDPKQEHLARSLVPEPGTIYLLGTGLVGLLVATGRKRERNVS